ncbi:MAG: hypothetical protein Kow0098_27730 [Ignavibacteriaceae bacterium]
MIGSIILTECFFYVKDQNETSQRENYYESDKKGCQQFSYCFTIKVIRSKINAKIMKNKKLFF